MKFTATIEKEQVNLMPTSTFGGKITVIDSEEKISSAIRRLEKEKILGFDTETRPSFSKNQQYKMSLLQLAGEDYCYLFRINKTGFHSDLEKLLANPAVTKIGLSLRDDFLMMRKFKRHFSPVNFIDIQSIITSYGIQELSLQKIYAILFGKKISKSQQLSNWEAETLTAAQQSYAATDAWATRCIYLKLMELEEIKPES